MAAEHPLAIDPIDIIEGVTQEHNVVRAFYEEAVTWCICC